MNTDFFELMMEPSESNISMWPWTSALKVAVINGEGVNIAKLPQNNIRLIHKLRARTLPSHMESMWIYTVHHTIQISGTFDVIVR